MFRAADKDGSGSLSLAELSTVMFPKATVAQRREIISFASYVGPAPSVMAESKEKAYSEETIGQLRELFNIYDTDGSGSIDRTEMAAALKAMASLTGGTADTNQSSAPTNLNVIEDAQALLESADDTGDGEISFDEFVQLMAPAFEPD